MRSKSIEKRRVKRGRTKEKEEEHKLTMPLTEDYINWMELSTKEKEDALMPRISSTDISDSVVESMSYTNSGLRKRILNFIKPTRPQMCEQ